MANTYDVLVLGAGPAGIAAARALKKAGASFLVLEARSRVGGRTWSCASFGTNKILDHGARWIHGSCADNSMVKLVAEMTFDHPEDAGTEYKLNLPKDMQADTNDTTTAPPFELSDSEESEEGSDPLIIKVQNSDAAPAPTKNLTKVLTRAEDGSISAKISSNKARKVAKKIFRQVVKSAMKDPLNKLKMESISTVDEKELDSASLMDVLLWMHQKDGSDISEEEKRDQFTSLCREQLVMKHEEVEKAAALLETDKERAEFREEVLALFNLEIYTFLECWEGAPIHRISAKNGMEGTCLSGGNTILPFGYGGLVKRLAYSLQNEYIRLQHEVLSLTTTVGASANVVVRCQVTNDDDGTKSLQEFHASACVVALPLGVLREAVREASNQAFFKPPLPSPLLHAIRSLGIAARDKIELLFDTCWWPQDIGRFSLACAHLQQTPTYHPYSTFIVESTSHLSPTTECPNILVCYVAGEFAKETADKSNAQIQEEVMTVLRQSQLASADTVIPDPVAIHVTRWLQDPFSRGSWTFYGKGSSPQDVRQFRENPECIGRHLFFAGEHTCDGGTVKGDDMGCVHGAWVSGEMAAEAALKSIQ